MTNGGTISTGVPHMPLEQQLTRLTSYTCRGEGTGECHQRTQVSEDRFEECRAVLIRSFGSLLRYIVHSAERALLTSLRGRNVSMG